MIKAFRADTHTDSITEVEFCSEYDDYFLEVGSGHLFYKDGLDIVYKKNFIDAKKFLIVEIIKRMELELKIIKNIKKRLSSVLDLNE